MFNIDLPKKEKTINYELTYQGQTEARHTNNKNYILKIEKVVKFRMSLVSQVFVCETFT